MTIALRDLTEDDVGEAYLGWMRDPEVTRHLESRFGEQTLDSIREFVRSNAGREDTLLLAIVLAGDGRHIGNVKVGPLNPHHRTADLGLLIGDAAGRGRGYGPEAIRLASAEACRRLDARKLTASCYSGNVASARAFVKAGWTEEGVRPAQFLDDDGEVHDQLLFGFRC